MDGCRLSVSHEMARKKADVGGLLESYAAAAVALTRFRC